MCVEALEALETDLWARLYQGLGEKSQSSGSSLIDEPEVMSGHNDEKLLRMDRKLALILSSNGKLAFETVCLLLNRFQCEADRDRYHETQELTPLA